ncbi:DUF3631 domain-containing protein [Nocardioides marmoriginsengisoli]|uniref:DUF3631 domain-containing protein n=1 Tax=Nocardioides marmoriginsengisoli TaxID=661483 RepID=UPI001622F430|nr:DUF3631 domain-containing protein [Nocardioides marmoriginsengisoli]
MIKFFSHNPRVLLGTTAAVLFRLIDKESPTLVVDEADTVFTANGPNSDTIRTVLNGGYAYGQKVYRTNMNTMVIDEFNAYAPVALVGIDNQAMPPTILTRSIPIKMTRATRATALEVWDEYDHEGYREYLEAQLIRLRDVVPYREKPDLPDHLTNRDAEIWRCLFSVANAVGGDWPDRVAAASGSLRWDEITSEQTKVLEGTREIFAGIKVNALAGQDLTDRINKTDGLDFLTAKGLNSILAAYGVRPKKSNGKSMYRRADLEASWDKWLDPLPIEEILPNLPVEGLGEVGEPRPVAMSVVVDSDDEDIR